MKLQTILFTLIICCVAMGQLYAESIVREFPAKSGQKLDIKLSIGADIVVEGWDEDRVRVRVTSDSDADDYDMRFIRESWGIKVEAEYTKKFGSHRGDIKVEISVPQRFDLALHTLGGDIEIENIDGKFTGKTLGGDIDLTDLKGFVELATLGGDVDVQDSELDGLLKTMGGDVEFEDVSGSVRGKAFGGDVAYNNYRPREKEEYRVRESARYNRERELTEEQEAYLREREAYEREKKEYARDREEYRRDRESAARERAEYDRERANRAREEAEERRREAEEQRREAEERRREAEEARREAESARRDRDYDNWKDDRSTNAININKMGGDIDIPSARGGAKVKTMGGDIEVQSANDFVVATTFGGDIKLEKINGWVEAKTYGGDIFVEVIGDDRYGKKDVELLSYSGDVELIVPRGLDMDIDIELAYTKNYDEQPKIISDFELNIEESENWVRSHGQAKRYLYAKGRTGSGRHSVKIKTVNGNVYLKEK